MDTLLRHFLSLRFHLREPRWQKDQLYFSGSNQHRAFGAVTKYSGQIQELLFLRTFVLANIRFHNVMSFKDVGLRLEPQTLLAAHDLRHGKRPAGSPLHDVRQHVALSMREATNSDSWTTLL
jgi:hypothetical protein